MKTARVATFVDEIMKTAKVATFADETGRVTTFPDEELGTYYLSTHRNRNAVSNSFSFHYSCVTRDRSGWSTLLGTQTMDLGLGTQTTVCGPRLVVCGPRLVICGPRLVVCGPGLVVCGQGTAFQSGNLLNCGR